MNFFQTLLYWDAQGVLALNRLHTPALDRLAWLLSDTMVWVPAAAVFLYVLIKNKRSAAVPVLLALALMIVFADQISSSFIKPLVGRLRPTRNMELIPFLDIVSGYRGGRFGFLSSHAANVFAFAVFTALLFRSRPYSGFIYLWALLIALSRVYLAVHYPLDVLAGICLGVLSGILFYRLLSLFLVKPFKGDRQFTPSQFLRRDIALLIFTLLLTLAVLCLAAWRLP